MPLSPGDLLADKYRIEAEIGRGAFGRVYRTRDITLDRVVAIKELHKGADDLGSIVFNDYVRRFEREARVQARFSHPNIVHVYELLRPADDRLYLVMEYVDGGSLREYLARRGALPVDEAVRIMLDLLAGLAAVHADERDIVHRDIKPSNVLLTRAGQAKLTDFGLAQVGDESMRSGAGQPHPGSPMYMSPEQETTNAYLYPASDVFSAGCVLFELLTGVIYKQARRRKQGLTDLRPDVPQWLAEVVARALAREAEERFSDAEEMRQRIVAAQQVTAAVQVRPAGAGREQAEERRPAEVKVEAEARVKAEAAEGGRVAAGERRRSNLLLELAPGVTLELVCVPAGEFLMGSDKAQDPLAFDDELPQHRLHLPEYWIGKYPVTVAQFAAFVKATGYKTTAEQRGGGWNWGKEIKGANWRQPRGPGSDVAQKAGHPVTLVSWYDAIAFCAWASRVTGRQVWLPSEAKWEKAARGAGGRLYPWGNAAPTEELCNLNNVQDTTLVGRYSPQGDSPYGCADMAGNVWEWTLSLWGREGEKPTFGYPYVASDGREDQTAGNDMRRVVRGGSFLNVARPVRCACRYGFVPEYRYDLLGFRVASPGL